MFYANLKPILIVHLKLTMLFYCKYTRCVPIYRKNIVFLKIYFIRQIN